MPFRTVASLARPAALAVVLCLPAAAPADDLLVAWPDGRVERDGFAFDAEGGAAFEPLRVVRTSPARARAAGDGEALEVELWNGDRLGGRLAAGAGGAERLRVLVGGEAGLALGVPIDALRRVAFPARRSAAGTEELAAPELGDRLYRLAGTGVDVLDGTLDGFTAEGLRFESRLGLREYPWSDVVALFVEPLDPPEPTRGAPRSVALDLVGGGRLHGLLERWDDDVVRLRLPWDEVFAVAPDAVLLCTTDDGRLAYLSDREPAAVEGGSAFGDDLGLVFRPAFDRAVHGEPLVAGGRTWPRGIGVQAPTAIRFELAPGAWSRLRGAVAIDDSTAELGERGAAVFAVRLDDEEVWRSEVVRGGQAPVELPTLELGEAASVELVVEMGPRLNLGDRADWLDVRLERSAAPR